MLLDRPQEERALIVAICRLTDEERAAIMMAQRLIDDDILYPNARSVRSKSKRALEKKACPAQADRKDSLGLFQECEDRAAMRDHANEDRAKAT